MSETYPISNVTLAVTTLLVTAALLAGGCAHGDATTPAPEPQQESAVEQPAPPPPKTSWELELEAREAWEKYKAEHTWEERLEAMGLEEDPGLDPDPERIWIRDGRAYQIHKFEKVGALFNNQPLGRVRPHRNVAVDAEIYRDDEESIWVWLPAVEGPDRALQAHREKYPIRDLSPEAKEQLIELRNEFQVLSPPASSTVVRFVESSGGLPQSGSWRNSADVADMNGDGHPDIIVPPQRGSFFNRIPLIFLGDGEGNWSVWSDLKWPAKDLDYGTVRAADFNDDGLMDLAFAVHLQGVTVYLGDGRGGFVDSSKGLPEKTFPTRRIEVADLDADGDLDIIAVTEGPQINIENPSPEEPKLRVLLNEGGGRRWSEHLVGEPRRYLGGDWLSLGDFNGDRYPDWVASSHAFHGRDVVWLSDGEMNWTAFGRGFFPLYSYISAVTTGTFTSTERDDAVMSFTRTWSTSVNPEEVAHPAFERVSGIDLVSFTGPEPVRTPIIRWDSERPTWAMATGDMDGDGNLDIVYTRKEPAENGVLLGDGAGNFRRATVDGWDFVENTAYDLTLADLDEDGRLDVLILFENSSKEMNVKNGSVRVYLNRTGDGSE